MVAHRVVSIRKIFPKLYRAHWLPGWYARAYYGSHDEFPFIPHTSQIMAAPQHPPIVNLTVAVVLAITAIKALYSIVRIITTSAPDFAYYYNSQTSLLPPVSRLVYLPLMLLPFDIAQGVWVVISAVCLMLVIWKLGRPFGLLLALSYLSFPTQFTLGMGQVNLIALFLLVTAVFHEQDKRSASAGVLFTLSILLKPELILLAPAFLISRRWNMMRWSLGVMMLAIVGAAVLFGLDTYTKYATRFIETMIGWNDVAIYYNQGMSGAIARMGGSAYAYLLITGAFVGFTWYRYWKRRVMFPHTIWRSLPLFILIEPIAWQHHFVFLIPTVLFLWSTHKTSRIRIGLLLSYALISWNFAEPQFLATMPLGWFVASHGTLGVLILWILSL